MTVSDSTAVTTSESLPRSGFRFRKENYGYLFIAPFVIGWLLFGLYPVYNTFYLSFTNTTMISKTSEWVGLANYQRLYADDTYKTAVKNTWL